jgi:hypothetical protein
VPNDVPVFLSNQRNDGCGIAPQSIDEIRFGARFKRGKIDAADPASVIRSFVSNVRGASVELIPLFNDTLLHRGGRTPPRRLLLSYLHHPIRLHILGQFAIFEAVRAAFMYGHTAFGRLTPRWPAESNPLRSR